MGVWTNHSAVFEPHGPITEKYSKKWANHSAVFETYGLITEQYSKQMGMYRRHDLRCRRAVEGVVWRLVEVGRGVLRPVSHWLAEITIGSDWGG